MEADAETNSQTKLRKSYRRVGGRTEGPRRDRDSTKRLLVSHKATVTPTKVYFLMPLLKYSNV